MNISQHLMRAVPCLRVMCSLPALLTLVALASTTLDAQDFWRRPVTPLPGPVTDLGIDSSGTVYAATRDGIYAADADYNWSMVTLPHWADEYTIISAGAEHVVFGTARYGIVHLGGDRESWARTLQWPIDAGLRALATHPLGGEILAASADTAGEWHLLRSLDSGAHWSRVPGASAGNISGVLVLSDGTALVSSDSGITRSTSPSRDDWEWVVSDARFGGGSLAAMSDGVVLATSYDRRILRSTDRGVTWSDGAPGLPAGNIGPIMSAPNREALVVVQGIVTRTTNSGESWTPIDTHASTMRVLRDARGALIRSDGYGISRSTDDGRTWSDANNGLNTGIVTGIVAYDARLIVAVQQNGLLHRSSDGGATWTTSLTLVEASPEGRASAGGLVLDTATGDLWVMAWANGMFRSSDTGRTWTGIRPSPDMVEAADALPGGRIAVISGRTLHVTSDHGATWKSDRALPGFAYGFGVTESRGKLYIASLYGLYRSDDSGSTWEQVYDGVAYSIVADARGRLYLGGEAIMLRSDDEGAVWYVATNLTSDRGWKLALAPGGIAVVARRDFGVSVSTDYGETWTLEPSGHHNRGALALTIGRAGRIYVGSDGSGIYYSREVRATAVPGELPAAPPSLTAVPNPTSGASVLVARLERAAHVTLLVYDMTGARAATLCDERRDAGEHRFAVDGLRQGSYTVVMSTSAGEIVSSHLTVAR